MSARSAFLTVLLLVMTVLLAACGADATAAPTATSQAPATSPPAVSQGQQLLQELVAKAKQERSFSANVRSTIGPATGDLAAAFKQRFGLDNLQVELDAAASEYQLFAQTRSALQSGSPPPVDALEGPDGSHLPMVTAGLAQKVDNWELLLAEINPRVASGEFKAEQLSPEPLAGYSFNWSHTIYVGLYNPRLMSAADLPDSRLDMGDAKYKGKVASSPWLLDPWTHLVQYYDKERVLSAAKGMGDNAALIDIFPASVNRMLIGELPYAEVNTQYYFRTKADDPAAPVELHWFKDYTPTGGVMNMIPKNSGSPASAALFVMWMTTPEATAIWSKYVPELVNLFAGGKTVDELETRMKEAGAGPIVTWFDDPESVEAFKWLSSQEGAQYQNALSKALTQRQ